MLYAYLPIQPGLELVNEARIAAQEP